MWLFLIGWWCSSDLGSSLKFPSPSWVGALVPTEEQKALPLRRNLDPALIATLQLIFLFETFIHLAGPGLKLLHTGSSISVAACGISRCGMWSL